MSTYSSAAGSMTALIDYPVTLHRASLSFRQSCQSASIGAARKLIASHFKDSQDGLCAPLSDFFSPAESDINRRAAFLDVAKQARAN